MPVTTPDDKPIVATAVVLLLHVPPPVLLNVIAEATHTADAPVIGDGSGSTVTVRVTAHPAAGI